MVRRIKKRDNPQKCVILTKRRTLHVLHNNFVRATSEPQPKTGDAPATKKLRAKNEQREDFCVAKTL